MGIKIEKKNKYQSFLIYFSILAAYIVLGEFTSLINFLPKPTILLDSFSSLWTDYNLLAEISISTTAVYLGLFIGIIFIEIASSFIISLFNEKRNVMQLFNFIKYFPAFFFAILFSFWFSDSIIAEIIFAIIAVIAILLSSIQSALNSTNKNYVDTSLSYNISKGKLAHIIWKDAQPKVYSNLKRVHYYLWALIMIFEFIGTFNGVGSVYYFAHNYNDYAAFFSLAILIAILIWIGDSLIILLKNKLINWE